MAYGNTNSNGQAPSMFGRWGIISFVVGGVVLVIGFAAAGSLVENLDAHDLMVVQSPVEGQLTVHVEPGLKWQGFGAVTKYPRRAQYEFSNKSQNNDNSKRLRFNDGGHANLYGAISWEMPLKPDDIIRIHKTFGSAQGVEQQAVARMIDAAVYLAGPLMSSTESSGERRSELLQYIGDQAENGVYVTQVREKEVVDVLGIKKLVAVTEIVRDDKGLPKRQQSSMLKDFNINLQPLSINEIKYDKIVEDQIAQRQKATTEVQISQANAKRAEQDALTIAKQGEASAAKAKWDQETIKAKEITLAEQEKQVAELQGKQRLEVAKLDAQAAEQFKRAEILKGEGEAGRRKLVLEADGALEKKLEAYKEVSFRFADAIKGAQPGAWSPAVVMGGTSSAAASGNAQTLIDLFTAKTARELSLDMTVPKGKTTDGAAAAAAVRR